MMPNITRGSRVHGLLSYLWGPGRSDEHQAPHVVAGYKAADRLEPPRDADGAPELAGLAHRLRAPVDAQERPMERYVWQCSLSLPKDEGVLGDEKWAAIAHRFIAEMGFEQCRWIAVHHGQSVGGNDHIHFVVTLANADGSKPVIRNDARRSQEVCDRLEDEFGLAKRTPGRGTATSRKGTTRSELARAERDGVPVTREVLRRAVRAAAAGARTEAEWIANLAAAGVQTQPYAEGGIVRGYSVSLVEDDPKKEVWFAGGTLDGELSLPRLRERLWAGQALREEDWETAAVEAPVPRSLTTAERAALWEAAAKRLRMSAAELQELDHDDPRWAQAAQACADVMVQAAAVAEPDNPRGDLSRAADLIVRATASSRRYEDAERSRSIARQIGAVGAQIRLAGMARRRGEEPLWSAVIVTVAQLALLVALWREAQNDRAAATVAKTASRQLIGVVEQAQARSRTTVPTRTRVPAPRPAESREQAPPREA
jgi:hypothetical protein